MTLAIIMVMAKPNKELPPATSSGMSEKTTRTTLTTKKSTLANQPGP
jgi:hypothetical protein